MTLTESCITFDFLVSAVLVLIAKTHFSSEIDATLRSIKQHLITTYQEQDVEKVIGLFEKSIKNIRELLDKHNVKGH